MNLKQIRSLNKDLQVTDSHSGNTGRSALALNLRESYTMRGENCPAVSSKVYYPRIKKCADGSYIMFNQDSRVSASVFYAKSVDGLHYSKRFPLFSVKPTVRDDGEEDKLCYASCDAIVLKNGSILAFASYRYNKGYVLDAKYSGLLMRRSDDNGVTWSSERLIYLGRNWEPSAIELPSGEIQVYFSHTAPKFYYDKTVRTDSKIHTSSGSALIRSYDGGEHWTPDVMGPPYAAHRVTQNYVETMANGTKIYTNQMPVAVALNNGDIALATESDMMAGRFLLTLSYSHDNWERPLEMDEDGPEDKLPAFTYGAGPYITQFPSGETVLGYNTANKYFLRMGDERGKGFAEAADLTAFGGREGYWGNILADTAHSLLVSMPNVREIRGENGKIVACDNDMMIERYYLNHDIRAVEYKNENTWDETCGDALFAGGLSRAQIAVRAAYDSENVYIRVDRTDDVLEHRDGEKIYMSFGESFVTCDYSLEGEVYATVNHRQSKEISVKTELFGKLDGPAFSENGAVTVVTVPRRLLPECKEFGIFVKMSDYCGDNKLTEGLAGVDENDLDTYYRVAIG